MPSKVIIIVIEFMFLGINIFWALLRAHFNPGLTARAKMGLSWAQNVFMPASLNCIVLLILILFGQLHLLVFNPSLLDFNASLFMFLVCFHPQLLLVISIVYFYFCPLKLSLKY